MAKYRKKPVVIEAVQWDGQLDTKPDWLRSANVDVNMQRILEIPTLEGTMDARIGDWIIRGIKGEIYPCKPDIFAATYEPVEEIPNAD